MKKAVEWIGGVTTCIAMILISIIPMIVIFFMPEKKENGGK
jgi:hypothetical protein